MPQENIEMVTMSERLSTKMITESLITGIVKVITLNLPFAKNYKKTVNIIDVL